MSVDDCHKFRFLNSIQLIYATTGLLFATRCEFKESLVYLHLAQEIYRFVERETTGTPLPTTQFNNDFNDHLVSQLSNKTNKNPCLKKGSVPEAQAFGFFINGGLDKRKLQIKHADTMKFTAQVYQEMGDSDKTKTYTVRALDFQLRNDCYTPIEWANECAELAEGFLFENYYAQAEYCLKSAKFVLNRDSRKPQNPDCQRPQVDVLIRLGSFYLEYLSFMVKCLSDENFKGTPAQVSHQAFAFPMLESYIKWSDLFSDSLPLAQKAYKTCHKCIKYFNKALDFFQPKQESEKNDENDDDETDELVQFSHTHLKIVQQMSLAYKLLGIVITDEASVGHDHQYECLIKRYNILTPYAQNIDIDQQSLQDIWHELSGVSSEIFDLKYNAIKKDQSPYGTSNTRQIKELNEYGRQCLQMTTKFFQCGENWQTQSQSLIIEALEEVKRIQKNHQNNLDEQFDLESNVFCEYVKMKTRIADKSMKLVVQTAPERIAMLQQAEFHWKQLLDLLNATQTGIDQLDTNECTFSNYVRDRIIEVENMIQQVNSKLGKVH